MNGNILKRSPDGTYSSCRHGDPASLLVLVAKHEITQSGDISVCKRGSLTLVDGATTCRL